MKRLFILVLAVMVIFSAGRCFAGWVDDNPDKNLSVAVIEYDNKHPSVSTTIVVGHRIIGWMLASATSSTGALYDSATLAGCSSTNQFGELYTTAAYSPSVWFPFPKKIANGLVVGGNTTTSQYQYYTIYYL